MNAHRMTPDRLFESENPLIERLGEIFFDELPRSPGMYKMYGASERLLYVGKAKDLRSRLQTYRRAKPGRESRKVIRLVRMVHRIELEQLPGEEEALLRQLYIMEHQLTVPFDLPSQLMRKLTPLHYELKAPGLLQDKNIKPLLIDWFSGRSAELQDLIIAHAREHSLLEAFIGKVILKDMESLHYFFERCARRNFEMMETLDLSSPLIPQEKLDDYLLQPA